MLSFMNEYFKKHSYFRTQQGIMIVSNLSVQPREKSVVQSLLASFESFLLSINGNPRPQFNLTQFKNCSNNDRRSCAKVIYELSLSIPQNVPAYADVIRLIITSGTLKQPNQKSFAEHIADICDEEIKRLFSAKNRQWKQINQIGIFIGELYTREGLKASIMRTWLEKVMELALKDPAAIKTLLSIYKIIWHKLKSRDVSNFKLCVQLLRNLSSQGKIPDEYKKWTNDIIGSSEMSKASSVLSLRSETSVSDPSQRPTGAIPKM